MSKERKIYWCCICDKIHRVSSVKGKEHYAENHVDFSRDNVVKSE